MIEKKRIGGKKTIASLALRIIGIIAWMIPLFIISLTLSCSQNKSELNNNPIMKDGLFLKYRITHKHKGREVTPASWIKVSFKDKGNGLFVYHVETPKKSYNLHSCDKYFRDKQLGDAPILLDGLGPLWFLPESMAENSLGASFKVIGQDKKSGYSVYVVKKTTNKDFKFFYDKNTGVLLAIENSGTSALLTKYSLIGSNLDGILKK